MKSLCSGGEMEPLSLPDARRKDHSDLKQEIKNFLKATANSQAGRRVCPLCGEWMDYVDTDFSIYGEDSHFRVRLPVCSCAGKSSAKLPS